MTAPRLRSFPAERPSSPSHLPLGAVRRSPQPRGLTSAMNLGVPRSRGRPSGVAAGAVLPVEPDGRRQR
jgi:hypothetical protein